MAETGGAAVAIKGRPIHTIATHDQSKMTHLSDLAAHWAIRFIRVAEELFPGISRAEIKYFSPMEIGGRSFDELVAAGIFPIGIGGGDCDEHQTENQFRKERECEFTLVLTNLGIRNLPVLRKFAEFVLKRDTQSGAQAFDFANLVKVATRDAGLDPSSARRFFFPAFSAIFKAECNRLAKNEVAMTEDKICWGKDLAELLDGWAKERELDREAPELKNILCYRDSVLAGNLTSFDLAHLVGFFADAEISAEDTRSWIYRALDIFFEGQRRFQEAKADFEKAEKKEVPGPQGKKILLVAGTSDHSNFQQFARSQGAQVIVQQRSNGQAAIFGSKGNPRKGKPGVRIEGDIACAIRSEEKRLQGDNKRMDWKSLGQDESVPDTFWHKTGSEILLNGSLTHPDVSPSKIPFERKVELVQIALDQTRFEPSRETDCKAGICTSTREHPCPWHHLGLWRCRKLRFDSR